MLSEQQVRLEAEDLVVDWLVHEGYDPVYGARPLRRTLQVRQAFHPLPVSRRSD
jgi:ATP-dependent Clp protease ATP-binding subunit ClpA